MHLGMWGYQVVGKVSAHIRDRRKGWRAASWNSSEAAALYCEGGILPRRNILCPRIGLNRARLADRTTAKQLQLSYRGQSPTPLQPLLCGIA